MPDFSAGKPVHMKFRYDGKAREVHDVTFEFDWDTFIGFEVRKAGKFSNKIKRYSIEKATLDTVEIWSDDPTDRAII